MVGLPGSQIPDPRAAALSHPTGELQTKAKQVCVPKGAPARPYTPAGVRWFRCPGQNSQSPLPPLGIPRPSRGLLPALSAVGSSPLASVPLTSPSPAALDRGRRPAAKQVAHLFGAHGMDAAAPKPLGRRQECVDSRSREAAGTPGKAPPPPPISLVRSPRMLETQLRSAFGLESLCPGLQPETERSTPRFGEPCPGLQPYRQRDPLPERSRCTQPANEREGEPARWQPRPGWHQVQGKPNQSAPLCVPQAEEALSVHTAGT